MPGLSVRRSSTLAGDLLGAAVAFGLGFLGGVAAAAVFGNVPTSRVRGSVRSMQARQARRTAITGRAGVERILGAFEEEPGLRELRVVLVRKDLVELHGWVADRRTGSHAVRLAGRAAPALGITNRILVRGEDDLDAQSPGPEPA